MDSRAEGSNRAVAAAERPGTAFAIGPYRVDPSTYEVRRGDAVVPVEPQVFELIVLLAENPDRVVTRDELVERVWRGRIVSEATISSRIKAARQALGDDGSAQRVIRTVHGRGFRLVAPVEVVPDCGESTTLPPGLTAPATEVVPPPDRPSLAVLPFDVRAPDGPAKLLAEGLTEDVTSGLSRVRSFFVVARGSAEAVTERSRDARAVASVLGVRYLVQGSLRLAGASLRVSVQLIEAASRQAIWGGSFDGELAESFEVQDRITEAVIGALEPSILVAEVGRIRRQRPEDPAAYDLVLRAMPDCWALDRVRCRAAMTLLEQAIALDPGYGLAQALLSWCHGQHCVYNWTPDPAEHRAQALRLARQAAALTPDDPLVLIMLGTAECVAADVVAAAVHVGKGLELDPNSAWGWNRSGYVQCYLGNPEVAVEHFRRSLRLSPFDPMRHNVYVGLGLACFVAGNYDDALAWIDRALLEAPEILWVHRLVAACAAMAGDLERARGSVRVIEGYSPGLRVDDIVAAIPHQKADVRERYREALTRAGFKI